MIAFGSCVWQNGVQHQREVDSIAVNMAFHRIFRVAPCSKPISGFDGKKCVTDENVAMREECSFKQICRIEVQMQFTGQFWCDEFVT